MGTLIAMKYPTKMMLELADHTYVQCGTGQKSWGCWGGKTGGDAFNQGTGSTRRADAIAGQDEKAGITCYLVNGVCHQAANRILSPANILVAKARGYGVSSLMFSAYGKVRFWPCHAPFHRHTDIHGDLTACQPQDEKLTGWAAPGNTKAMQRYLKSVKNAYRRFSEKEAGLVDNMAFNLSLFRHELQLRLGNDSPQELKGLLQAKEAQEVRHAELFERGNNKGKTMNTTDAADMVREFNALTLEFQDDLANCLSETRYQKLVLLKRDERIRLADPDIICRLYGDDVVDKVYGQI
ncbi:MAG: hypothetical protein JKY21_06065 [Alcanivorax sp.]|nr:hypothetical protein [Alcanivorax sp.]